MTATPDFKIRTDCPLCGSLETELLLDLGMSPIANRLYSTAEESLAAPRYPLGLNLCRACGHVYQPVMIDPKELYAESYPYVSGTSPAFRRHLQELAEKLIRERQLKPGDLVVDVGSNDGTLLGFFKLAGMRVVGVDPAREIAERANLLGIPTICDYFGPDVARRIEMQHGPAKVVTAVNVFAHAPELGPIADAARELLIPGGEFVIEVGDFDAMADRGWFQTVYHEHFHYHRLFPLIGFLERHGLTPVSWERISTQGSSMRLCSQLLTREKAVGVALNDPSDQWELSSAGRIPPDVSLLRDVASRLPLHDYIKTFGSVYGYGAPAQLTTIAAAWQLSRNGSLTYRKIEAVFDDNPLKVGKFVPGTDIPIVSSQALSELEPQAPVAIFSANFAQVIKERWPGKNLFVPVKEWE